ncbi:Uncharacterized protein SCF082_LOCUS12790, partial [Durusdinium trenchii]
YTGEFLRRRALAALVALLVASAFVVQGQSPLWATPAFALWLQVLWCAFVNASERRWLRIEPASFEVRGRGGRAEYRDRQILSLADRIDSIRRAGHDIDEERLVTLWIETASGERTIPIRLRPRSQDEELLLRRFVGRLQEMLVQRAEQQLARELPVEAEGWRWQGSEIRFQARRSESPVIVHVDKLAHIDIRSSMITLWAQGDAEPLIRLSGAGRDAWLLSRLLEHRVPEWADDDAEGVDLPFGRLLIERRPPVWMALAAVTAGGIGILLALLLLGTAAVMQLLDLALVGGALLFPGVVSLYVARNLHAGVFRCHEQGLVKVGLWGATALRYDEIEVMELDTFDDLRDRVSEKVAERLAEDLLESGEVTWTDGLKLGSEGLEFRRRSLLGARKSPELIPYDAILEFSIDEGWFHVWANYQERAVVKVACASPNFYPGLLLFDRLVAAMGHEVNGLGDWVNSQSLRDCDLSGIGHFRSTPDAGGTDSRPVSRYPSRSESRPG